MSGNLREHSSFDVVKILKDIWKYKLIIIAFTIISTVFMIVKIEFFTPDTYTASGVLYVSNQSSSDSDETITSSKILASRVLSTTYIETLRLRSFLMDVSDSIDNKYSWRQIGNMMMVTPVNETEYLAILVTAGSPEDAYLITDAILNRAPSKFIETFKGGEAIIVDKAIYPQAPNSKGGLKKTVVSMFAGAILGVLFVCLLSFMDKKVHKSDDVAKRYNVSILGEVME